MTFTATIADSGATYSTINSAVSAIQANSSVVSGGLQQQDIVLNTLAIGYNPISPDTYGGWNANGFHSTLGATAANSANGNASVLTRALAYNSANGAYWNTTGVAYPNNGVSITALNTTISNLQVYHNPGGYGASSFYTKFPGLTVANCILASRRNNNSITVGIGGSATVTTSLITSSGAAAAAVIDQVAPGDVLQLINNTIANISGSTSGTAIQTDNYATVVMTNTAMINFTNEVNNSGANVSGSHDATSNASPANAKFPTTAMQTSVALTDFVGGSSLNDFRLASGAAKLRSTGTSVSGISFDWTGSTAIPQGTEYDIGCWAFAVTVVISPRAYAAFLA